RGPGPAGAARLGAAALLLLEDRVADLDALVADVDAGRARDERGHVVAALLAEGAALDVAPSAGGGSHACPAARVVRDSTLISALGRAGAPGREPRAESVPDRGARVAP